MAGLRRQNPDQWRPQNLSQSQRSPNPSDFVPVSSSSPTRLSGRPFAPSQSSAKPVDKPPHPAFKKSRRSSRSRSPHFSVSPQFPRDHHHGERTRTRRASRSPPPRHHNREYREHREHRQRSRSRSRQAHAHSQRRDSNRPRRSRSRSRNRKQSPAPTQFRKQSPAPTQFRKQSPAPKQFRKQSPAPKQFRKHSRSPSQSLHQPRRDHHPSARERSLSAKRYKLSAKKAHRARSPSPSNRRSKHFEDFPPTDLLSRKHHTVRRSRSPTGHPQQDRNSARPFQRAAELLPRHKRSRRDRSPSPQRSPVRRSRAYSPNYFHDSKRQRTASRSTSRQPRGRTRVRSPAEGEAMDPYQYYPYGRRDSRNPPPHHHHPPPPIPPNYAYAGSPAYQSPFGGARIPPPAQSPPYPPSQYGSPYQQGPPPGHYRPASHAGSPGPHYPPPPRPIPQDRRSSSGQPGPPEPHSGSKSGTRRPMFSNMTWTPEAGTRGGVPTAPPARDRKASKDQNRADPGGDDEDDPFRPSKDLRAEDEHEKAQKQGPRPTEESSHAGASHVDTKIRFNMKPKSSVTAPPPALDLSSSRARDPRPPRGNHHHDDRHRRHYHDDRYSRDHRNYHDRGGRGERPEKLSEKLFPRHIPPPKPEKPTIPRPRLSAELRASKSAFSRKVGDGSVVGSGTYGKVYRSHAVYANLTVALKRIRTDNDRDGYPVTSVREIKLLQLLKHPNIVMLREVMVEHKDCYMVFEYISHDLTGLLQHPTLQLSEADKKYFAKQMFEGLDYLHSRGVLHRDIKAANILVTQEGTLKLADFGLARNFAKRRDLDYTNRVVTIWYRSPELLLGETRYGPAIDIWSAACVLVEIFTKHAIFPGDGGEIDQLDRLYAVLGTPTRAEWPKIADMAWFELLRPARKKASTFEAKYKHRMQPEAFNLVKLMLSYDPEKRPTAAEVLEHPYFVSEEPKAAVSVDLTNLDGDWHEFESKALRKEREKEAEAEREAQQQSGEKRKVEEEADGENAAKKVKANEAQNGTDSAGVSTGEQ